MSPHTLPFFPILFIVLTLLFIYFSKRKPSFWLGKPPHVEHVLPIVFIAVQLLVVGIGVDWIATQLQINDTQAVDETVQFLNQNPLGALFSLTLGAVGEELFFRGILFTTLGPFVSSLIFGFFHAGYGSFIQIIGSFIAGLVLCHARITYKSIFPGLGGHLLYNLFVVFILGA